ncbi:4Fe-4S dicluster domain-containing protein [Candidatus Dependentiae bacterium]|nr:4Fe-4S dicluster domain-containing protein [Candidatus Dependentiae bacterium]
MEEKIIKSDKLNPKLKYEIMKIPGGENLLKCFACGTCTVSCPVWADDHTFNPRQLIRKLIIGLEEEILADDRIWYCTTCYDCYERCPQDVRITEIIMALKNYAVTKGVIHEAFTAQVTEIYKFGRLYEVDEFFNAKREKLGLPQLDSDPAKVRDIYTETDLEKHVDKSNLQNESEGEK